MLAKPFKLYFDFLEFQYLEPHFFIQPLTLRFLFISIGDSKYSC